MNFGHFTLHSTPVIQKSFVVCRKDVTNRKHKGQQCNRWMCQSMSIKPLLTFVVFTHKQRKKELKAWGRESERKRKLQQNVTCMSGIEGEQQYWLLLSTKVLRNCFYLKVDFCLRLRCGDLQQLLQHWYFPFVFDYGFGYFLCVIVIRKRERDLCLLVDTRRRNRYPNTNFAIFFCSFTLLSINQRQQNDSPAHWLAVSQRGSVSVDKTMESQWTYI